MDDFEGVIDIEKGKILASESISINVLKNEKNIMLYPFCSTSKSLRFKEIRYESPDKKFYLEVTANNLYGMAKIWDFDILRFVFSKIDTIAKRTGHYPSDIAFSAYECLKFLKRNPKAGKNIKWLKSALDRLASTTYKGNIFYKDSKQVVGFTLIKYGYFERSTGIDKISISLDERLVSSLRSSNSLISINSRLLEEPSGLKKRLIELVALKTIDASEWVVSIDELQSLCANTWVLPRFKNEIKSFVDLDWFISEVKEDEASFLKFKNKA